MQLTRRLFPAVLAAFAALPALADPMQPIEGVWWEEHKKMQIEVRGGVAKVIENSSADKFNDGTTFPQNFPVGTVIARFSGVKELHGAKRYQGKCITRSNGWVMADCGDYSATLTEGKYPKFSIGMFTFVREKQLTPFAKSQRK